MELNSMFQAPYSNPSELFSNYALAMSWDQRLRDALEQKGWSKRELSRRADVPYDNVTKYVAGEVKQPRGDTLDRLAHALEIDPIFLARGISPTTGDTEVPIMGYLGAGAEVEPDYEQIPPEGLEQVTIPFALPDDMIAFRVKGDSMLPQFKDDTIVVVFREQRRAIESFYGEEAAVRTRDGRRFIKTIFRGERGVNLISWNAQPIENVQLEWIGEIFAVIPPSTFRRAMRQGGVQGRLNLKIA